MRSRFLALSCAPAMLVVTLAASLFAVQVSYACSMTGRRQSHCCCPAESFDDAAGRVTPACCERTIEQDRHSAVMLKRDSTAPIVWTPGALLALVAAPHARGPQHVLPTQLARGPPAGPPVYVRTCRYLI